MSAEELLMAGALDDCLSALQSEIRSNPADAKLRVFLFQLATVLGQWDRAMTQLNVAAEMDPDVLLMAQACRPLLNCEVLRGEVFAGKRGPLVFGEPAEWVGLLLQALQLVAAGEHAAAAESRDQAFEQAPAVPGAVNGQEFAWLADADPRLGPVLEAVVDGRYYWIPFANILFVKVEEPTDLRDCVWLPASFIWQNGGQSVGFIPVRYPGSETSSDSAIRLGRKTEWEEAPAGWYFGQGQRLLATDAGDTPLLDVRELRFEAQAEEPA